MSKSFHTERFNPINQNKKGCLIMLKQLLLQVFLMIAGFLTPYIYQWMLGHFPGAPISESGILDMLVYIVSWIFVGTRVYRFRFIQQYNKYQTNAKMFNIFVK